MKFLRFKRWLILSLIVSLVSFGTMAQITVRGTIVSSDDNMPLPGVSIIVEGTTRGTVSDVNGAYALEVDANALLVFSFIGFDNVRELVNGRSQINVIMTPEVSQISEIIVMGYSSQSKAELSSAVVTLDGEKIRGVTTSDIGTMLQGKAAGVLVSSSTGQPGASSQIRIRGTGSITAQASPLYVVDGIPHGSFNPNDVESITILKDAGATALFGSAAAGGVIVVTTKHAKRNQPTSVNFRSTYGQKEALQGNFEMMTGEELYDTHKAMFSPALFNMQRPAELRERNFNWLDAAFSTGNLQNHYLSFSGASEKTRYFASVDYYQEDGTLINTNYDRLSARLNLNTQLNNSVEMNVRVNYSNSGNQGASSYMTSEDGYKNTPWDSPYDADGNIVKIDSDTRPDNGKRWYSQDRRNFLHSELYNYSKWGGSSLMNDVQFNWTITDWLIFTTSNRFSQSVSKSQTFVDPRTYHPSYSNGYKSELISQSQSWNTSNLLKVKQSLNSHSFDGLVGYEYGEYSSEYTGAEGVGMPNGMDALNSASVYGITGYRVPGAGWSVFSQLQYNYGGKYFATVSGRVDASSKFGPKKREGFFPAGSLAWLISQEDFLAGNYTISYLKLRGSHGVTGNSNIGSFQYLSTYNLNSTYQDNVGATPSRLPNPYLSWETAHMTGVGIDLGLWRRIDLAIDLYNIDNKDLLLNVPVSPSTGFFEITDNVGSVRNRGIEVQLDTENINGRNFSWSSSFNIAFNKNEVRETPDDASFIQAAGSTTVYQQVKRGQDIFSWYMPKWVGVDSNNGDPLWEKLVRDQDGSIIDRITTNNYNEADLQVVGKATPKFSGGFNNTMSYKNLTLNVSTNFSYGGDIYNRSREFFDADGAYLGYNMQKLRPEWNRWEQPGDDATHPKLAMNGNKASNKTSSRYLEDGSYFRVKNISLSYNAPRNWIESMKIQNLRLFVSADNVLTVSKFSGMDPEISLERSAWSLAGLYTFSYPISRQYLFGVDITF